MGLVGVAAGTAWAAGGLPALRTAAVTTVWLMPTLLVATGILLVGRAIVPRGPLSGPLILITVGLLAMAFQLELVTARVFNGAGPAALVLGGVMIAMSRRPDDPMAAIVRRNWSVFLPSRQRPHGIAPRKFILRCLFGDLELNLAEAGYRKSIPRITIDVTVLAGLVEICVPPTWTVRSGRLHLARGTVFDGELHGSEPVPEEPQDEERGQNLVVINVQGWRGRVVVRRGHSVAPPASAPGLPESSAT